LEFTLKRAQEDLEKTTQDKLKGLMHIEELNDILHKKDINADLPPLNPVGPTFREPNRLSSPTKFH
jgi:hypothetical protein